MERNHYQYTVGQNTEKHRINTHPIIHCPTSKGVSEVSERASKWAQRSTRVKRVVRSKQKSEQCEWTSEWTSEWPSTSVCMNMLSKMLKRMWAWWLFSWLQCNPTITHLFHLSLLPQLRSFSETLSLRHSSRFLSPLIKTSWTSIGGSMWLSTFLIRLSSNRAIKTNECDVVTTHIQC